MSAVVSYSEEEARSDLFAIPTRLDEAIQATNAALQLMACALDLKGEDRLDAMLTAKKLCFRGAALLSLQIEGVT